MKKLFFILALIAILTTGCVMPGVYKPITTIDKFDGYTINKTQKNILSMKFLEDIVCLDIQRFQKDDLVLYKLILQYGPTSNWLFIESGESLILLVDGKRMGFTGDGSMQHRNVLSGGSIVEKAYYNITPEQIIEIANAQEVSVKIIGSQYYEERKFIKSTFNNFKQFYEEYVK